MTGLLNGIERLRIRNFRVLRDVELYDLTPITALLGPNGSGKSTVFDALRLIVESFTGGFAEAWERRGGVAETRTRESTGPVQVEFGCRVEGDSYDYRLAVDEEDGAPVIVEERLTWREAGQDQSVDVLEFHRGAGTVKVPGAAGNATELVGQDVLGVVAIGQVATNPQVAAFLKFVSRCQVSDLDVELMRKGVRTKSRTARLSSSGDNVAVVVRRLRQQRPDAWAKILGSLRRYVPGLVDIEPFSLGDGSQIVRLREQRAGQPILPDHISDGTLKLLGYLVALQDQASVLFMEEPENQVHPSLPYLLAEDARMAAAETGQVVVATHSPYFVDALHPDEVWMMFRNDQGFAEVRRAAENRSLVAMLEAGGLLGSLWTEGYFGVGDPLTRSGRPR
ncbi:AAA family ATPase [Amycolatopsis minnesotensis]|uniref:AAA family ATPase n=1 Tax=Amycolatopsis minnesotensis TaxID=337894 RepID=A0ABN2SIW5_9PSEU